METLCSAVLNKQEIEELYNQWQRAVIETDIYYLEELMSTDFIAVSNGLKTKSKREELLWLIVRNVKYLSWSDKSMTIEGYENDAFVSCKQSLEVLIYELSAKIDREIMLTFVRKDNKWYLQRMTEKCC